MGGQNLELLEGFLVSGGLSDLQRVELDGLRQGPVEKKNSYNHNQVKIVL